MPFYRFGDLSLEVEPEEMETRAELARFWSSLALVRTVGEDRKYQYHLSIRLHDNGWMAPPPMGRLVFQANGFSGLEDVDSFYLTDGSSVFHLQFLSGRADVYLAPSFFAKSEILRSNFWSFALLKLLRPLGFYSLHAAGLTSKAGQGVLIIGPSGSGKSTLALGLIREGWGYLSDDAVVLHSVSDRVCALALRKHFYIDASAAPVNHDLPLGDLVADNGGGYRRRVHLDDTGLRRQRAPECIPDVLVFARIVPEGSSTLVPLDRTTALKRLLGAGGTQLFDRRTMRQHLEVLKRLLRQATSFELRAGLDLYRNPATLIHLLREANSKEATWPASLSS